MARASGAVRVRYAARNKWGAIDGYAIYGRHGQSTGKRRHGRRAIDRRYEGVLSGRRAMDRQTARYQRRTMAAIFKHNPQAENPSSVKCEFLKFYH